MSSRLLLETRVLTVAAPAYLEKHGRPAAPADLENHACIQFLDPLTGNAFEWEFRRDGQGPAGCQFGAVLNDGCCDDDCRLRIGSGYRTGAGHQRATDISPLAS
jgi:DNA-binding transcriptional LysR family regulator